MRVRRQIILDRQTFVSKHNFSIYVSLVLWHGKFILTTTIFPGNIGYYDVARLKFDVIWSPGVVTVSKAVSGNFQKDGKISRGTNEISSKKYLTSRPYKAPWPS